MSRKSQHATAERHTTAANSVLAKEIGVLLQLHSEFTRACFSISIVGSMVNCIQTNNNIQIEPSSVAGYLPAQPLFGPELGRDLIGNGANEELCRAALAIGNQLQLCVDLSAAYTRIGHRHFGSIDALADAWRRLANACYVFEYMIDCALESAAASALKPTRIVFGPLLKRIGSGQYPCIDDHGSVSLPGWAERRASSRFTLAAIPAHIVFNSSKSRVEIIDLSPGGIGLVGVEGLHVGDTFKLVVGDLAAIPCTTIWCDQNRIGAAFETSIHSMDFDYIRNSITTSQ